MCIAGWLMFAINRGKKLSHMIRYSPAYQVMASIRLQLASFWDWSVGSMHRASTKSIANSGGRIRPQPVEWMPWGGYYKWLWTTSALVVNATVVLWKWVTEMGCLSKQFSIFINVQVSLMWNLGPSWWQPLLLIVRIWLAIVTIWARCVKYVSLSCSTLLAQQMRIVYFSGVINGELIRHNIVNMTSAPMIFTM